MRSSSKEGVFEAARPHVGSARPQDDKRPSQRHKMEPPQLALNIQLKNQRQSAAKEDPQNLASKLVAPKLVKSNKKAETLPAQPKIFTKKAS